MQFHKACDDDQVVYSTICMYFENKDGSCSTSLHDRTVKEAKQFAKDLGYVEPKWYNPFGAKLHLTLFKQT